MTVSDGRTEQGRFETEWAQRWHEAQIGELAGNARVTEDQLRKQRLYEFRLEAEHRGLLNELESTGDVKKSSRRAVL